MSTDEIHNLIGGQINAGENLEMPAANAAAELVEQLKSKNMVTPNVMVAALTQGEIALFFALFVELTKLEESFAKDIVFNGNGEEIAVACKAIGVSELQFMTIYKKTRKKSGPNRADSSQEYVNKMLTFFRTMNEENSVKALKSWGFLTDDGASFG